jgi:predicted NodU family carbamoyl transferase
LHDLADFVRGRFPISYLNVLNSTRQFVSMQHQGGGQRRFVQHFGQTKARMIFVDHHLAHAISTYANSGFDEAAVVVVDGRGA